VTGDGESEVDTPVGRGLSDVIVAAAATDAEIVALLAALASLAPSGSVSHPVPAGWTTPRPPFRPPGAWDAPRG
jgi:hypothetical protein